MTKAPRGSMPLSSPPRPYYQDDYVTIYHMNCRDYLPLNALILTDPPYGISHPTDYSKRGRARLAACHDYPPVHGDGERFDPSWLTEVDVPCILWGANYYADKLPAVSGWLVWDKERPHELDQATGELAWTNCVKGVRVFRHLWHGMMRASEQGENYHPTQKPVRLMSWCIGLADRFLPSPPPVVFDPYMGSGPVLRAAKDLKRKAIGVEIEEKYCEIAAKRMRQEVLL